MNLNDFSPRSSVDLDTVCKVFGGLDGLRWCVWSLIEREAGNFGKLPYTVSGGALVPIGSNDPSKWVSLIEASKWFSEGLGSGIGVLVGCKGARGYSPGTVAFDFDGIIEPSTGALISGLDIHIVKAIDEIVAAGAYVEVSPSGKGLRAIALGVKPDWSKEKSTIGGHSVEVYDQNSTRFVTVTGEVWRPSSLASPSPLTLPTLPPEVIESVIDWLGLYKDGEAGEGSAPARSDLPVLSDAEIKAKLRQSRQGRGRRLWDGDLTEFGGDWSSADMAFCRLVARWSDDSSQIFRLWEDSALSKREKFKRKDYRERTIKAAIDSARKDALEGASRKAVKSQILADAIKDGDTNGILASRVAECGGKLPANLSSVVDILSFDKRLAGLFAFDEFTHGVVKLSSMYQVLGEVVACDKPPKLGDEWTDADTLQLTVWLQKKWGLNVDDSLVNLGVNTASRRMRVNSVTGALSGLVWDGVPRLSDMLITHFNACTREDSKKYLQAISVAWMVGACRRAFIAGSKMDSVLVLQGGQGFGKSSAIRALITAVAPHAFREHMPSLAYGEEASRSLRGVWVCELAELAFLDKASTEAIKSFITREVDSYRVPYARRAEIFPRTTVFTATTNQERWMRDETGGRRFWVFKVKSQIDVNRITEDAAQLWAEAVHLMKQGHANYLIEADVLMDAARSQSKRVELNVYDELIDTYIVQALIDGKLSGENLDTFRSQALHLWLMLPNHSESELAQKAKPFADALIRAGFERNISRGRTYYSLSEGLKLEIAEAQIVKT